MIEIASIIVHLKHMMSSSIRRRIFGRNSHSDMSTIKQLNIAETNEVIIGTRECSALKRRLLAMSIRRNAISAYFFGTQPPNVYAWSQSFYWLYYSARLLWGTTVLRTSKKWLPREKQEITRKFYEGHICYIYILIAGKVRGQRPSVRPPIPSIITASQHFLRNDDLHTVNRGITCHWFILRYFCTLLHSQLWLQKVVLESERSKN